jgi:glycosyltransferase involved in cell wall biosynthesis
MVIDDASTDGTGAIAESHHVDVIRVDRRAGLGKIRNLALEASSEPYVAFLNADCYPDPTWLGELRRTMVATRAAVVGGRQVEVRLGTVAERWKARHLRQDLGSRPVRDPDFLSGGNLLLDLTQLNGLRFDPRLMAAYEDVDFCRRARRSGRRLAYTPAACVAHDHRERLATLPRKVWSYGAASPTVGPVRSRREALRAFMRMHRRPNDHVARAIADDLRNRRVAWLLLDGYLLAASLFFFVQLAGLRRHAHGDPVGLPRGPWPPGSRPPRTTRDDLPDHHDVQQSLPQLRHLEVAPGCQGSRP